MTAGTATRAGLGRRTLIWGGTGSGALLGLLFGSSIVTIHGALALTTAAIVAAAATALGLVAGTLAALLMSDDASSRAAARHGDEPPTAAPEPPVILSRISVEETWSPVPATGHVPTLPSVVPTGHLPSSHGRRRRQDPPA